MQATVEQSDGMYMYDTYSPVARDLCSKLIESKGAVRGQGRFTAINPSQLGYNYYMYILYIYMYSGRVIWGNIQFEGCSIGLTEGMKLESRIFPDNEGPGYAIIDLLHYETLTRYLHV